MYVRENGDVAVHLLAGPLFIVGICSFATAWPGRVLDAAGLVSLVVLASSAESVRRMRLPAPIVGWLTLVYLSARWSALPANSTTAARGALTVVIIAAAVAALMHKNADAAVQSVRRASTFLLSWAYLVLVQDQAFLSDEEWRALFVHKNWCGFIAAILSMVFLDAVYRNGRRSSRLTLLLSVVLLLGSQSVTSLFAALIGAAALTVNRNRPIRQRKVSPGRGFGYAAALFLCAVLVACRRSVLQLFGRDPDLTGRTDLWSALLPLAGEHPWLGWGYYGFWSPAQAEVRDLWTKIGWQAPSAHSAYLDTLLQLGIIGVVLAAWFWGTLLTAALGSRAPLMPLLASLALLVLVQSFSERGFLSSTGLFLISLTLIYCSQHERFTQDVSPGSRVALDGIS